MQPTGSSQLVSLKAQLIRGSHLFFCVKLIHTNPKQACLLAIAPALQACLLAIAPAPQACP